MLVLALLLAIAAIFCFCFAMSVRGRSQAPFWVPLGLAFLTAAWILESVFVGGWRVTAH